MDHWFDLMSPTSFSGLPRALVLSLSLFWVKALFSGTWSALFFKGIGNLNLSYLNTKLQILTINYYVQVFTVSPEVKSICVRFLACLSGLCLLAFNTFGKHEKEGEGCTLDPEDQGWGPVYACSCCCHAQWTPFLCEMRAIVYQVQNGFGLLGSTVADVILLDGESL